MNQRGQEFSAFRLLIDAIMVMLILVIIVGIMSWVEGWRGEINQKRLLGGIVKAADARNGETVIEKEVIFKKESGFSTGTFGSEANLPEQCIKFYAVDSPAIILSPSETNITFTDEKIFDVYYRCIRNLDGSDCDLDQCKLCCWIAFGKELEPIT